MAAKTVSEFDRRELSAMLTTRDGAYLPATDVFVLYTIAMLQGIEDFSDGEVRDLRAALGRCPFTLVK